MLEEMDVDLDDVKRDKELQQELIQRTVEEMDEAEEEEEGPAGRAVNSMAPLFSQSFVLHLISTSRFIHLYVMFRYNFPK
jgi:hypothetical protein